jgi:hypothetical protein
MLLLHVDAATPLYINPQLVRVVMPNRPSGAHVYFDDIHSVEVTETVEAIAREIENIR